MSMRRIFEKAVGIGLGVLIVATLIIIAAVLFGGSAIGLLTLIVGFPVAFLLTTTLLLIVFVLVFLRKRK